MIRAIVLTVEITPRLSAGAMQLQSGTPVGAMSVDLFMQDFKLKNHVQ